MGYRRWRHRSARTCDRNPTDERYRTNSTRVSPVGATIEDGLRQHHEIDRRGRTGTKTPSALGMCAMQVIRGQRWGKCKWGGRRLRIVINFVDGD